MDFKQGRAMKKLQGGRFAKFGKLAIALIVIATMMLTIFGCTSIESKIRTSVESEFNELKNPTAESTELFLNSGLEELSTLGLNPVEFIQSWLNGFDYQIDSVTVEGNTATVEAQITVKQLGPVVDKSFDKMQEYITVVQTENQNVTQADMQEKFGELITDALESAEITTVSVTLVYFNDNNTWTPDASFNDNLLQAFIGQSEYLKL
jgi:hypothetical protein